MKTNIIQEKWHYTAPYILNPQHPITIQVIGAGGNGSQILTQLARINYSLKQLGHLGIYVTCFDDDMVTDANMGRQLFSPADVGLNKAIVLITRLNQYFGTSWKAQPFKFGSNVNSSDRSANITISCVDSVDARKIINALINNKNSVNTRDPLTTNYYWMDLGNSQNSGQFIIGTCQKITQPKESKTLAPITELKNIFQKYPDFLKQKTKQNGPSCSLAEALSKQDLFINSTLVNLAGGLLWKMFREGKINYHGAFLNLKSMDLAKINL